LSFRNRIYGHLQRKPIAASRRQEKVRTIVPVCFPKYWVIHATPAVPPNEAAAAERDQHHARGIENSGLRVENAAA
jgi:hypothetical protein